MTASAVIFEEVAPALPGAPTNPITARPSIDPGGEKDQPRVADQEGLVRCHPPQLIENLKVAESQELSSVRDGWFYPGAETAQAIV